MMIQCCRVYLLICLPKAFHSELSEPADYISEGLSISMVDFLVRMRNLHIYMCKS